MIPKSFKKSKKSKTKLKKGPPKNWPPQKSKRLNQWLNPKKLENRPPACLFTDANSVSKKQKVKNPPQKSKKLKTKLKKGPPKMRHLKIQKIKLVVKFKKL
jgi:hypothetical protein